VHGIEGRVSRCMEPACQHEVPWQPLSCPLPGPHPSSPALTCPYSSPPVCLRPAAWNVLDLIVVATGWLSFSSLGNYTAVRAEPVTRARGGGAGAG
jgi:hypothetical protein